MNVAPYLTVAACWGSTFLLVRIAARHSSPLVIVELRLLTGAVVTVAAARLSSIHLTHTPTALRPWIGLGAVLSTLVAVVPFFLLALGERQVSSGTASIVNATAPLWASPRRRCSRLDSP